jgi:SNF2 family DNA or RNA helicase
MDSSNSINTMFGKFLKRTNLQTHPYQVEGVNFCIRNETQGQVIAGKCIYGGIIADEMGLGKTIQILGTVVSHWVPRTLIVVPRALLEQWEQVILKTLGHKVFVYHGGSRSMAALHSRPMVLTTYGMIAAGPSQKKRKQGAPEQVKLIHSIQWDRIIYDEAHHLRNKSTSVHQGALKLQTAISWLVTGTPIQNREADFYSLCAVLKIPHSYYINELNLPALTAAFILRRTKASVGLALPPLKFTTVEVPWASETEYHLAENIHALVQFSHVTLNHIHSAVGALAEVTLPLLIRARQSCIYPPLMKNTFQQMIRNDVIEDDSALEDALTCCSKIDRVVSTIAERRTNGRAKLIFCHFLGEINILDERLTRLDMAVLTFDGRTPEAKRNEILTTPCDVLIIQIQTGCEGLNLQHFKEIYFVSPHWNPAVEDQAIARCHRLGQQAEVDVFRFVMVGFDEAKKTLSLDEYAAKVQELKRKIMTRFDRQEQPDQPDQDEDPEQDED